MKFGLYAMDPVTRECMLCPGASAFTDILDLLVSAGRRVESVHLSDWRELVGPNTPEELAWAEAVLAGKDPPLPPRS